VWRVDGLTELHIGVWSIASISMVCVQNGRLKCKNSSPCRMHQKSYILRIKMEFFSEEGAQLPPRSLFQCGGGHPLPTPYPLSAPSAPRLSRLRRSQLGASTGADARDQHTGITRIINEHRETTSCITHLPSRYLLGVAATPSELRLWGLIWNSADENHRKRYLARCPGHCQVILQSTVVVRQARGIL